MDGQVERLGIFIASEVPGEPSASEGAVDTAIRVIKQLLEDKRRWDFVEAQTNGDAWAARDSTSGRGFRLHNTGVLGQHAWAESPSGGIGHTAREAVDNLISKCNYSRSIRYTGRRPR